MKYARFAAMVSARAVTTSRSLSVGVLRGLASTILFAVLVPITGCDDEPSCVITTSLTGGYTDGIRWNLSGRDSCGVGKPTNLDPDGSALVFVNRDSAVEQHLILVPEVGIPTVGVYSGRVLLIAGGNIWDSGPGNCTIEVKRFELEDWTQIDFISISGLAVCQAPLLSASPEIEDATLVETIEWNAHLHDEQLPFEFI